jgi:hypothetical protein
MDNELGSLRRHGAASAPVKPMADRGETDVMDTDESEPQRIRHRAGIVDGLGRAVDSLAAG